MLPFSNQIPTWLLHQELWRFVGFVSTILGLLCYALSSSFNNLFGNWNFTKLFAYIVLSIIICLATLFPKVWQYSPSNSFRVRMAFLVFTVTSVYSFFLDKAVNGKQDAYSLVSCVAFATMTLSLSRQIHCGFEVDLLYFFLAALIAQLMQIKKWLVVVGVLFSYLLVILRSSLAATRENGYRMLTDPNPVVVQVDSDQSNVDHALLMTRLLACIEELRKRNSTLIEIISAHVKDYIEDMDDSKLVTDHNFVVDLLPFRIIDDLREAAASRAAARREREFSDAYIDCRKACLKECLLRITESQEEPNTLQHENDTVGRWVKAANVALKLLFPCERRLCDRVFDGLSSAADRCFIEICRDATIQLLNFADSLASRGPSVDRMFQNLYIFVVLRDLIPEFQSIFIEGLSVILVNEAVKVQNKLTEAILASYKEMRNLIFDSEVTKLVASDGGVQLMTRDAMNFVLYCCHSREKLEPILHEYLEGAVGAGTSSSSFSVEMVSILELLERKLELISESYEDPALRNFFMMNNRKHIENQIKKCDLGTHLSDDWVRHNTAKMQQNLELYYRTSWNRVLDYLKLEESLVRNVTAESMRDRLSLFNKNFKEICTVHTTWFVEDEKLREEIITCLGNIVSVAYGNFIGKFLDVLATNASECIKYGIDDIEARLKDLFRPSWMYTELVA